MKRSKIDKIIDKSCNIPSGKKKKGVIHVDLVVKLVRDRVDHLQLVCVACYQDDWRGLFTL